MASLLAIVVILCVLCGTDGKMSTMRMQPYSLRFRMGTEWKLPRYVAIIMGGRVLSRFRVRTEIVVFASV